MSRQRKKKRAGWLKRKLVGPRGMGVRGKKIKRRKENERLKQWRIAEVKLL